MAIADVIIPSIEVSTVASADKLSIPASEYAVAVEQIKRNIPATSDAQVAAEKYLQESASSTPGFRESVHRQLGQYAREDAVKGIVGPFIASHTLLWFLTCIHH